MINLHVYQTIQIKLSNYRARNLLLINSFYLIFTYLEIQTTEAVAQRCSVKKIFLEISQNSQKNACARVSFLIKNFSNMFYGKKQKPGNAGNQQKAF